MQRKRISSPEFRTLRPESLTLVSRPQAGSDKDQVMHFSVRSRILFPQKRQDRTFVCARELSFLDLEAVADAKAAGIKAKSNLTITSKAALILKHTTNIQPSIDRLEY